MTVWPASPAAASWPPAGSGRAAPAGPPEGGGRPGWLRRTPSLGIALAVAVLVGIGLPGMLPFEARRTLAVLAVGEPLGALVLVLGALPLLPLARLAWGGAPAAPPARPRCRVSSRSALRCEHPAVHVAVVVEQLGRREPEGQLLRRRVDAVRRVDEVLRRLEGEVAADRAGRRLSGAGRAVDGAHDGHRVGALEHGRNEWSGADEVDQAAEERPFAMDRLGGLGRGG